MGQRREAGLPPGPIHPDLQPAARLGARAFEIFEKISPLKKSDPENLATYGLIPIQQPADVYEGWGHAGRGGWSWYTGSAALTARAGFPSLCARSIASQAGQAALVADVYQKWIVGAVPAAAQNAAVLFANSGSPGNPQVQAILRHLPRTSPSA